MENHPPRHAYLPQLPFTGTHWQFQADPTQVQSTMNDVRCMNDIAFMFCDRLEGPALGTQAFVRKEAGKRGMPPGRCSQLHPPLARAHLVHKGCAGSGHMAYPRRPKRQPHLVTHLVWSTAGGPMATRWRFAFHLEDTSYSNSGLGACGGARASGSAAASSGELS